METPYLLVVTTTARQEDAEELAQAIVEKRLAACAQVQGPITSIYRWQGKVENEQEWKCTFKTSRDLYKKLETELGDSHPYDTPEIVALPIVQGSADYLAWLEEELQA
ncbi:MAG: divalent-cation tolerance protein CutA [Proteobacteria bacterium]|nr:divalent-cation tolerance protein CutA [Pseudomonadota bacterium]